MANIKNFGLVGVGSDVQFGKAGPRLKNTSGAFQFRDAADGEFADITANEITTAALSSHLGKIVQVGTAGKLVQGVAVDTLASKAYADDAVAVETSRAQGVEGGLNTRLTTAEGTLTNHGGRITTLESKAAFDTAALEAEINRIETAVGLETDGQLGTWAANTYLGTAGTIKSAVEALDAAIKARADAIAAEITARTNADTLIREDFAAADTATLTSANNYTDSKISSLGAAFEYVGTVTGGPVETPFDLATLTQKDAGDYYKVATGGWFKVGAGAAFQVNTQDGLVFNTTAGVDVIDNTNSEVAGTADFIAVTGSTTTGFVVDVAGAFKGRVTDLETDLAAEITRATDKDTDLQEELDATQVGAGLAASGAYDAPTDSTYLNSSVSLKDGLLKLDAALASFGTGSVTALQAEVDRTQSALGAMVDQTSGPTSGSWVNTAFVGTNYLNVTNQEPTSATEAFKVLDAALKAEETARISADSALSDRVTTAEGTIGTGTLTTTAQTLIGAVNELTAVDHTAGARASISVAGVGLSYSPSTGVITSNATSANTPDTLVARSATGQVAVGALTTNTLRVDSWTDGRRGSIVYAGLNNNAGINEEIYFGTSPIAGSYDLQIVGGATVALHNGAVGGMLFLDGEKRVITDAGISYNAATDTLTVAGNVIAAAPTAGNHVATKTYVDDSVAAEATARDAAIASAVAAGVEHAARGFYVAFGDGTTALPAFAGMVTRVKISVTNNTGTDVTIAGLVASGDVDTAATGLYIVETAFDNTTGSAMSIVSAGTTGVAFVEYL